jgi:hypothetical protein
MFEEIIIMIGFALASVVISYVCLRFTSRYIWVIFQVLAVPGIIIHEMCHMLMCFITGTHIESVAFTVFRKSNRFKNDSRYMFGGHVEVDNQHMSFLQALLVGLAPMYILFWLFFYLLDQFFNADLPYMLWLLYGFFMVSIILAAAPSFADLVVIFNSFTFDLRHSVYQVFLLLLSIGTAILVIVMNHWVIPHEIISYLLIAGIYFLYKYPFMLIRYVFHKLTRDEYRNIIREATRPSRKRRVKKPSKDKEGEWW